MTLPAIRVLYVDDEPGLLEIGKLFLERKGGVCVSTNTSAQDAFNLLNTKNYDAIISDYQMPGMDGIEFLKLVRASGNTIPFIIFTGRGREEIVIQALNEGADFYLQKGGASEAQFAELINKVTYAVERRKADQELNEAGERYKAFISVSNTGAWEYHADTGFLWCSPEYLSMLGRDASQFDFSGAENLNKVWIDLIHPEDRERADRHFKDYLANGSNGLYESKFRMRHSDGHWVWIWSRGCTLRDKGGTFTSKTVGTHIDVTESRQTEDTIRNNIERLRMAQEIGLTGSWELNLENGTIWASDQAFRTFGIPQPCDGIVSLEDVEARIPKREIVHQALVNLLENGDDYNIEYAIEPADNSGQKIVHSVARILFDARKIPARVVGVIQDITERKRVEESLRRSEILLRSMIDSPQSIIIFSLDLNYQYLAFNARHQETMRAIWGVDIRSGMNMLEVIGYKSDREKAQENFNRALSGENFSLIEEYGDDALGRKFWEDTYSPIYDENHRVIGLTVYVIEITGQKQAEREIHETERRMEDIIDFLPDATFAINELGQVIAWNRAIEEMTGVRAVDILGKGNFEYALSFYGERRPILIDLVMMREQGPLNNYTAVQTNGDALTAETSLARVGGKDTCLWGKSVRFKNSLGIVVGAIESIRDITDRKMVEIALENSLNLYRAIFETTGAATIIINSDTTIILANSGFAKLSGFTIDELEGKKSWTEFVNCEDLEG